jgi:hypothetical protein
MPTQTPFLLDDLEDIGRTSELAESDLKALRAVADWIKTFVVKPHKDWPRFERSYARTPDRRS